MLHSSQGGNGCENTNSTSYSSRKSKSLVIKLMIRTFTFLFALTTINKTLLRLQGVEEFRTKHIRRYLKTIVERSSSTHINQRSTRIPHIIWFLHQDVDFVPATISSDLNDRSENIFNTIRRYRNVWNEPGAKVNYLGKKSCYNMIANASPQLARYYDLEVNNVHRRDDMCRLATLYLNGGYFFDIDIQVEEALIPNHDQSFISTMTCTGTCFYQGFIASSPKHPILEKSMQIMLNFFDYHSRAKDYGPNLVNSHRFELSYAMATAYNELPNSTKNEVFLLEEIQLKLVHEEAAQTKQQQIYPNATRQYGSGRCNWVLHDASSSKIHFYEHYLGSEQCRRESIPHQLWFSYQHNIIKTRAPHAIHKNVINTIQKYREFWNEPEAPVYFLDDDDCKLAIKSLIPALVHHFKNEKIRAYKADICRNAAIYRHGGYYMDIDLKVVNPVKPKQHTTFLAPMSCGPSLDLASCILNAFFACTPNHPIIYSSLEKMQYIYETNGDNYLLGPFTMYNAFQELSNNDVKKHIELYHETHLDGDGNGKDDIYPEIIRQPSNAKHCNWIVHDPNKEVVYFFSRFFGYGPCE